MSNEIDPQKLAERLAALDKPFHEAPSEGGGFGDDVEDGTYQAITQRWGFFETKKNAACIKLAFEIALDVKYEGSVVEKVWNLEPHVQDPSLNPDEVANRLGFLKRDLKRLGALEVDDEDFSYADVRPGSELLERLLDLPVEIALKTKNGYQNVYINAVTGEKVQGRAGMMPKSDIPSDLEPQTLPGDFARPSASAVHGDDDIPF